MITGISLSALGEAFETILVRHEMGQAAARVPISWRLLARVDDKRIVVAAVLSREPCQ